MNINEILRKVDDVKAGATYWFVRTDDGRFFDDFIENKYIAIGWDYISLYDVKHSGAAAIKEKIVKEENIDVSTFGGKVKVSTTYNKIHTFVSLEKDDIVIIPSKNSDTLAFGIIADESAYEDVNAKEFRKRRKVKWIEIKQISSLNPIFYQVKSNRHTISNVTHYAPSIDQVMGVLFTKNNRTHYVLNIEKTGDISFDDLQIFMSHVKTLLGKVNDTFGFGENIDDFSVKISIQSPGPFELIKTAGKSLAVLAFILAQTSCVNENNKPADIDASIRSFMDENRKTLEETDQVIKNLQINTQELTQPFNDDGK